MIAIGNAASALMCILLVYLLHRGAPLRFVSNALVFVLLAFVAAVAGPTGGDANAALHTVAIVPGVAILLSGWRVGVAWAGTVCALVCVLWFLRATGFEFPVRLEPEQLAVSKFPGLIALTIGISTVILLHERIKDRALHELADARRASEEAEKARLRLENHMQETQKLESLGVLAGGVAHDFNNLLTCILGNASLLTNAGDRKTEQLAEDIVVAAEQAGDLTHQLLAYAGRSRSVREPLSLSDLVKRVESLARMAMAPDIELEFELATDPTTTMADPGQIQQVILNLVTNASEAIVAAGRVRVRTGMAPIGVDAFEDIVFAEPLTAASYAFVEVEDDGPGMTAEVSARIFDPFFTTKSEGRGLGLSAVLGIVRSHDGVIGVDSQPGRGTRIRVLFPASDRTAQLEEEKTPPAMRVEEGAALVVDDEESVRRFAARALRDMGFVVHEACEGAEALRVVDTTTDLRVVLLDATMPGIRGDLILEEIARRRPDLHVILSTGDAEGFSSVDPVGPNRHWLPKPYRAAALQEVAAQAVGRSGAGGA